MGLFSFVGKAIGGIAKAVKGARDDRDDRKAKEAIEKYKKSQAKAEASAGGSGTVAQSVAGFDLSGMMPIILIVIALLFFLKK